MQKYNIKNHLTKNKTIALLAAVILNLAIYNTLKTDETIPRFHPKLGATIMDKSTYAASSKFGELTEKRLADIYVFAWHEGLDQRDPTQWEFYVVPERMLPKGQKT